MLKNNKNSLDLQFHLDVESSTRDSFITSCIVSGIICAICTYICMPVYAKEYIKNEFKILFFMFYDKFYYLSEKLLVMFSLVEVSLIDTVSKILCRNVLEEKDYISNQEHVFKAYNVSKNNYNSILSRKTTELSEFKRGKIELEISANDTVLESSNIIQKSLDFSISVDVSCVGDVSESAFWDPEKAVVGSLLMLVWIGGVLLLQNYNNNNALLELALKNFGNGAGPSSPASSDAPVQETVFIVERPQQPLDLDFARKHNRLMELVRYFARFSPWAV